MAKQKKNNGNELDTILEQLKKSYGDESSESLDDILLDKSNSEEDLELNEILSKIFNPDSPIDKEPEEPIAEEAEAEEVVVEEQSEINEDIEFESETTLEESAEDIEAETEATLEEDNDKIEPKIAIEEAEETVSSGNQDAEAEVESIFNIMFAQNNNTPVQDEIEEEIEETAEYFEDNVLDAESDEEILIEDIEKESDEDGEFADINDLFEENDESVSFESESDQELESVAEEDVLIVSEDFVDSLLVEVSDDSETSEVVTKISDERIYISALPNEESVDNELIDEEIEGEETDAEIEEGEPEVERARLILDKSQYTFDPLQETLPRFAVSSEEKANQSAASSNEVASVLKESDTSNNLDSNDISLLLKLGYDDEVISKVGKEKTQEILLEKDSMFVPEPHKKPFGFCGKEFCDRKQIDSIKNKYRVAKRNIILSLASVTMIFLTIFALNVYFEFFSNRISSFPAIIVLEMLFVATICAIMHKKLFAGVMGILKFETDLYSLIAFLILTYFSYGAFALIIYTFNNGVVNSSDLMLFGIPISIYSILVIITDLVNCIRESKTFGMIASVDSFYIAEKQNTAQLSQFGDATEKKQDESTYRIRKASLVSGYFKKMSQSRITSVNLIYILGIVPTVSVIIGCCCLLLGDNFLRCAASMQLSMILCVPFSYIFVQSLSEFISSSKLNKNKVAFIGTESVIEYSSAKNLIFKDTDSIKITSYSEIQPNKRSIVESDVEIAHKVFNALNGPLSTIKETEDGDADYDRSSVIINEISDNGIDIYFESAINILIGDKQYMQSHNIKVKTDTNLNAATKGVDRSVIYIAFDGIPKLGFIINSKIRGDFAAVAELMEQNDIHIFVETYEPQINDVYFEQNKGTSIANVNVIKPQTFDSTDENQTGNGGLISIENSRNAARAIFAGKKIVEQRKHNRFLNILTAGIGAVFACLFMILTSTLNYLPFFAFMRTHTSLIFNIVMVSAMIPGIIKLVKQSKNDSLFN